MFSPGKPVRRARTIGCPGACGTSCSVVKDFNRRAVEHMVISSDDKASIAIDDLLVGPGGIAGAGMLCGPVHTVRGRKESSAVTHGIKNTVQVLDGHDVLSSPGPSSSSGNPIPPAN